MNTILLLGLGISIVGAISNILSDNKEVKEEPKKETKLYWTDSIQPYISNYDYRLLQDLLNTTNYLTPNDIMYLDIAGLDTYTASALTSAQKKIRSMM